jgi:hypothetical protein
MKICTLTVDRGDREVFFNFCLDQLRIIHNGNMDNAIIINDPPTNHEHDLVKRFRKGVAIAKEKGFDAVAVVESDDQYPSDYLQQMTLNGSDFVGYESTVYYNIRNKTWMHQTHPKRSSLFCTAFKISALDDFIWPSDHYLWLDIRLWEHARDKRKPVKFLGANPCTGIKHACGMVAGKSHYRLLENNDKDLSFLKTRTENYQYEFYSKLKL